MLVGTAKCNRGERGWGAVAEEWSKGGDARVVQQKLREAIYQEQLSFLKMRHSYGRFLVSSGMAYYEYICATPINIIKREEEASKKEKKKKGKRLKVAPILSEVENLFEHGLGDEHEGLCESGRQCEAGLLGDCFGRFRLLLGRLLLRTVPLGEKELDVIEERESQERGRPREDKKSRDHKMLGAPTVGSSRSLLAPRGRRCWRFHPRRADAASSWLLCSWRTILRSFGAACWDCPPHSCRIRRCTSMHTQCRRTSCAHTLAVMSWRRSRRNCAPQPAFPPWASPRLPLQRSGKRPKPCRAPRSQRSASLSPYLPFRTSARRFASGSSADR